MPMRHLRNGFGRRGVIATEAAILLPFLSLMLIIAIDYCRIFCATQTLRNCAHTGALYASATAQIPSSQDSGQAAKLAAVAEGAALSPPLPADNVSVSFDQQSATVTVQYEYQMLTPYLSSSGKVVLTRQETMALAPRPGN
jgi:Flp pilus assembly protein TadG